MSGNLFFSLKVTYQQTFALEFKCMCVLVVDDFPCLCRRELYHVQRELLRERTRCKALEEELENPMNIHRWRKLEVSQERQG